MTTPQSQHSMDTMLDYSLAPQLNGFQAPKVQSVWAICVSELNLYIL